MTPPVIPAKEDQRLEALRALGILDTPAEERFDRITRVAARALGVPIALVSLVDEARQWFKSRSGLDAPETPRDVSFCGHAILGDGALVIPDSLADSRFADNPLVIGEPRVRAYAGQPLRSLAGHNLGTLCVIDNRPHPWTDHELRVLRDLAAIAEGELNLATIGSVQAKLIEARAAAEAADRAKSAFLATMSHELRTPLNSVIGFSDLLSKRDCANLTARQRDFLGRIRTSGSHLLSLINDVLDLSKVESGGLELDIAELRLEDLIDEVVAHFEPRTVETGVELLTGIPPQLQPIRTDRHRLKQVLLNLVANAFKFTEAGRVTIWVGASPDGRALYLEVEDTGIGIAAEQQAHIFDAFRQASSSTARTHGGTGLGLAISSSLCSALGYELSVESEPGSGSTFRIQLG